MIAQTLQEGDLTIVQDALSEGLMKLREAIDDLRSEDAIDLGEICERLDALENFDGEEYRRAYLELAERVIETRVPSGSGQLIKLPVPPYDLMLPFKACALRKAGDVHPSSAEGPVVNKKPPSCPTVADEEERPQGADTKE